MLRLRSGERPPGGHKFHLKLEPDLTHLVLDLIQGIIAQIFGLTLESDFRQAPDFAHFVVREIGDRRARQESILQFIDDQMARHC